MRTASDDLAARARIRHAAIDLFGREGFGVGLRAIAEEAGVSLGLIRHHFGSKAGLREACDEQILEEIRLAKEEQFLDSDPAASMLNNLATIEQYAPMMRYLIQSFREGGSLARQFFERMVADAVDYTEKAVAEGVVVPSTDPAARARFITAAVLGGALLTYALDEDPDPQRSMQRWLDQMTLPALELYTHGLLTDRSMLDTYLKYMKDPPDEAAGG
jgi:TetR/AcrR family transcriptional regulator, regulator of cefoperazone and chloramphenicol sensitivity